MVVRKATAEKHVTEALPHPHGERNASEILLPTDHGKVTPENVNQNPTAVENRLNPSLSLEDPTDDSMFNLADPQTRAVLQMERSRTSKKHRIA